MIKKILIIFLFNFSMLFAHNPGGLFTISLDFINNSTNSKYYKVGLNILEVDDVEFRGTVGNISVNIKKQNLSDKLFTTVNTRLYDFFGNFKDEDKFPTNPPIIVQVWGGTILDLDQSGFMKRDINWITAKYGYALNSDYFFSFDKDSAQTDSLFRNSIPVLMANFNIGFHSIIIGNENFSLVEFPINDAISGPNIGLDLMLGMYRRLGRLGDCNFVCDVKLELGFERIFSKINMNIINTSVGLELAIADNSPYELNFGFWPNNSNLFYPLILTLKYKKMFIFLPEQINAQGFEIGFKTNVLGNR